MRSSRPIGLLTALFAVPALAQTIPIDRDQSRIHIYTVRDFGKKVERSSTRRGSAPIGDILPAASMAGMVRGSQLHISNVDALAPDTITAGPGTSIGGKATFVLAPGRSIAMTYNGNGAWEAVPDDALAGSAQSQSYLYSAPPALNLPIQYAQIYGPANIQDIFNASGNVPLYWDPLRPVPGVFSGMDVTAYRIGPSFPVPAGYTSWVAWLLANHPDWLMYLNDRQTIAYEIPNAAFKGMISSPTALTASGTGNISGTLMTIDTSPTPTPTFAIGQIVTGTGVAPCTTITGLVSGSGGAGTYDVLPSQTASGNISLSASTPSTALTVATVSSGSVAAGQTLTGPGVNTSTSITCGGTGGAGAYPVSPAQTVPSAQLTFTGNISSSSVAATGTGNITISGPTVTLDIASTPPPTGTFAVGQVLSGSGIAPCTVITTLGSGSGGVNTVTRYLFTSESTN